MKFGIIQFDNQHKLDKYLKERKLKLMETIASLNYEIPIYSSFKPYQERRDYHWLFCDSCRKYLGNFLKKEFLFWCPNYNFEDEDGWIGEPGRLCYSCLNKNLHPIYGSIMPDGRRIDYYCPLLDKEYKYWSDLYLDRYIPLKKAKAVKENTLIEGW